MLPDRKDPLVQPARSAPPDQPEPELAAVAAAQVIETLAIAARIMVAATLASTGALRLAAPALIRRQHRGPHAQPLTLPPLAIPIAVIELLCAATLLWNDTISVAAIFTAALLGIATLSMLLSSLRGSSGHCHLGRLSTSPIRPHDMALHLAMIAALLLVAAVPATAGWLVTSIGVVIAGGICLTVMLVAASRRAAPVAVAAIPEPTAVPPRSHSAEPPFIWTEPIA